MKILIVGNSLYDRTNKFVETILRSKYYSVIYIDLYNGLDFEKKSKFKKKIITLLTYTQSLIALFTCDILYFGADTHSRKLFSLSLFFKKKVVKDFYNSLYETNINDRRLYLPDSNIAKGFLEEDKRVILKAFKLIFLNKSEAKRYAEICDINIDLIDYKIIPVSKERMKEVKKKFYNGETDVINICWWGTYIPLHGLDKIIEACRILVGMNLNFKLYIFGDSEEKSTEYREYVRKLDLERYIIFNNTFTFKNGMLHDFLIENCDVALGTFGDSVKAKTVIANKEIDAVSMKAPLITGFSQALNEYFDGVEDIIMIDNNPEEIASKIFEISKMNTSILYKMTDKAYSIFNMNFSEEKLLENYKDLLEELTR